MSTDAAGLHPQVLALRERLRRDKVPHLTTLTIEEARAADLAAVVAGGGNAEPVGDVMETTIPGPATLEPAAADPPPGLRLRVYRPAGTGPWPVLVYFFGGGWSLGTLDTCDAICRMLTNAAGCVTVSVGYRLAPEHKFPAAVEDCYAGAAWAASHAEELGGDPARLAVGGDSSGGNLAAAVALMARDRGGPAIAHQLLVYPNTDYQARTPSMRDISDEYFFNPASVRWYWGLYLATPADGANPLASPLRADDLSGLPAATVITAEHDPLRDEGELYAKKLEEAGVPAKTLRYDGMIHGFFTMVGALHTARAAVLDAAEQLRGAFARE
ncbi:MAG: alpha/beta hydrolase [Actinomycetia bacterium]|nr:alpha/beta hydrolase [Actinomycetes bacterium]